MPGNIATISCQLMYDPTAIAPATIAAPPSGVWAPVGNAKVTISGVAILDESCQLTVPSIEITDSTTFTASQVGVTTGPTVFKFTATSTKVTANAQKVLCMGDIAQAVVNFTGTIIAGTSTAPLSRPYTIIIKIADAGQTKVIAQ